MIHPLVSICVPVYNVEKYIKHCIVTLFEQSYQNIEFIFIDDCTPDNSIKIIKETLLEYPNREESVKIIRHEKNKGLGEARNTAVNASSGEFILHVDSDDWIDQDALSRLVTIQQQNNADIVFYDMNRHYSGHSELEKNQLPPVCNADTAIRSLFNNYCSGCVWGKLIRKSLYTDNNIKVLGHVNQSEDYQVTPRLLFYSKTIACCHDTAYHYNLLNENSYSNNKTIKSYEQIAITKKVLNDFFVTKGHPEYASLMWKDTTIGLVRSKMWFARNRNCEMFHYVDDVIRQTFRERKVSLPLKHRILATIHNYYIFKAIMLIKH